MISGTPGVSLESRESVAAGIERGQLRAMCADACVETPGVSLEFVVDGCVRLFFGKNGDRAANGGAGTVAATTVVELRNRYYIY